eukprot:gene16847-23079_t
MKREQVIVDPLELLLNNNSSMNNSIPTIPSSSINQQVTDGASDQNQQLNLNADHVSSNSNRLSTRPLVTIVDQIDVLTDDFMRQCRKKPLNISEIGNDLNSLVILANNSAWKYVVQLSAKLLSNDQIEDIQYFQIIRFRFEGLFKLKMYDDLSQEVTDVLNKEESKIDSNVSLITSLRLLITEVKVMTGRSQEALEQIFFISKWLKSLNQSIIADFWIWQSKCSLINISIRLRQWKMAIQELKLLSIDIEFAIQLTNIESEKIILKKCLIIILSRLSKVLLQIGSLKSCKNYLKAAFECFNSEESLIQEKNLLLNLYLIEGLILFGTEQFENAMEKFELIISSEKQDISPEDFFNSFQPTIISKTSVKFPYTLATVLDRGEENLVAAAVNNYAVCSLYMKKISQAISQLENLILNNPSQNMTDPIIFNLCTLYDLSYAPDISTNKKKMLQRLAVKYFVDDPVLHWKSFRLA